MAVDSPDCFARQPAVRTDTAIVIDYQDNWKSLETPIRQRITFESCIFESLPHGDSKVTFPGNYRDHSAFIKATRPSNTVILRDSVFRNVNQQDGGVREAVLCGNCCRVPRDV